MNSEMQLLALDDSSLDSVAGGRRKHYYDDVSVKVALATNQTTVTNTTINATGNVNIGNQTIDQSDNFGE